MWSYTEPRHLHIYYQFINTLWLPGSIFYLERKKLIQLPFGHPQRSN